MALFGEKYGEITTNECFKLYNTTSDYLLLLRRDLEKAPYGKYEKDHNSLYMYVNDARDTVNILKRKCGMERMDYRLERQYEPIHELAKERGWIK